MRKHVGYLRYWKKLESVQRSDGEVAQILGTIHFCNSIFYGRLRKDYYVVIE